MNPLTAKEALEAYFFEARCKILDLAAILDRVDRGGAVADPRLAKLREALDVLRGDGAARAEQVQRVFSLEYDSAWEKPKPRF